MSTQVLKYQYTYVKKLCTPADYYYNKAKRIAQNDLRAQRLGELVMLRGRGSGDVHLTLVPIMIEEYGKWLAKVRSDFEINPLKAVQDINPYSHEPLVDLLAVLDNNSEEHRALKVSKIQEFFNTFAEIALRPLGPSTCYVEEKSSLMHSRQELAFNYLDKSIQQPLSNPSLLRKGDFEVIRNTFEDLVNSCNQVALICFRSYGYSRQYSLNGRGLSSGRNVYLDTSHIAMERINERPILMSSNYPDTNLDENGDSLRFYLVKCWSTYIRTTYPEGNSDYAAQADSKGISEAKAELVYSRQLGVATHYDLETDIYFDDITEDEVKTFPVYEAVIADDKSVIPDGVRTSHRNEGVNKAIEIAHYVKGWAQKLSGMYGVDHTWIIDNCDHAIRKYTDHLNGKMQNHYDMKSCK